MRVTTEENVKEVLAKIDNEIAELREMEKETRQEYVTHAGVAGRRRGLERARLLIVLTLAFE